MENPTNNAPQHGFSVATLLLLTAVVAIGLAASQTIWQQVDKLDRTAPPRYYWGPRQSSPFEERMEELAWRGVAGAVVGLFVGIAVGATRPRPILGVLLALPVGMCWGGLVGAALTEPESVLVVAVGSTLLILFAVVIRALSRRPK
jgi:hypothetical protein